MWKKKVFFSLNKKIIIRYITLAAGRLSKKDWDANTKQTKIDKVAVRKYDSTKEIDEQITKRVLILVDKYQTTMTQIALAWQFKKGIGSPIIGATKLNILKMRLHR